MNETIIVAASIPIDSERLVITQNAAIIYHVLKAVHLSEIADEWISSNIHIGTDDAIYVGGANGRVIGQSVSGRPAFEVTLNLNDHGVRVENTREYLSGHVHAKGGVVHALSSGIAKVRVRQNNGGIGAENYLAVEIATEGRFIAIGKIRYGRRIRREFIPHLGPIGIDSVIR